MRTYQMSVEHIQPDATVPQVQAAAQTVDKVDDGRVRPPSLMETLFRPERMQANGLKLAILILLVWACLGVENFISTANIHSIMYSVSAIGIAAVGMAFITLSGNLFMLSMAATAALSSIVFVSFLKFGLVPAILIVAAIGALIGLIQGLVVGIGNVNPIIATIAVASIIMGLGALYSGGLTIVGQGDSSWLGLGQFASLVPNQLVLFVALAISAELIVQRTRFGRELRLIGMNRTAARVAGIRIERTLVITFILAGCAAAVAGALFASQATQGNMKLGVGLDFDAIAAVLVGGISIRGGHGHILDALFGAIFLAIVSNILLVNGLSFEIQLMIKGLVVVAAVVLGALATQMRKS
ncbi:ABC transporter permease [Pseudomonas monteilii]